jgi:hypothetical protein
MGRWGSTEDDPEPYEPPHAQPRVRIKTASPIQFPQRKPPKNRIAEFEYESDGTMRAKEFIKRMVLDDERLQPRDMVPLIEQAGYSVSIVTLSNIRAEFRDSLKLLRRLGWRQPK